MKVHINVGENMFLNNSRIILTFIITFNVLACSVDTARSSKSWQVINLTAKNELDAGRKSAAICLDSETYSFDASRVAIVVDNAQVAHQQVSCRGNGIADDVLILVDFAAGEEKSIAVYRKSTATVAESIEKRTQAELAVRVGGTENGQGKYSGGSYVSLDSYVLPSDHKVGNKLFKYEGIGLESDQMAYRYYFDHRGSMDVFGKKTTDLVLQNVGHDGGDYHKLEDWGMDVLKVGSSFGIGTLAHWQDGQVNKMSVFSNLSSALYSGVNQAGFSLTFEKWQTPEQTVDAVVRYSMNYGDAKVKVNSTTSKPLKHLATGVVNHDLAANSYVKKDSEWGYLASYGKQSLAGDNLGLAVFFRQVNHKKITSDTTNHSVVLTPNNNEITYYFLADWQSGINGSANKEEFLLRLKKEVSLLNSPIKLTLSN